MVYRLLIVSMRLSVAKVTTYLALLLFVLGSGVVPVYGQQLISGVIREHSSKQPIMGAKISLTSALLATPLTLDSDNQGRFIFARLSPGLYTVTIAATDFQPLTQSLTIAPRAIQALELELEPASINAVVEVKASRDLLNEVPESSLAIIDQTFIDQLPRARSTNLPELVAAFVPSAIASHDNFIHLRGNELSLNTSINGVSFIDNPHQYFAPGLDPGAIQSFSVITGGFPAEYSQRFGGVIDAVTRSGFDSNGHGAITLGASTFLRDTAALEYGGHTKKLGYFFYLTGFQSQRFINPPQPQQLHDFGKGLRSFAQLDYRANTSNTFHLLLFNSGANFEIPNTFDEQAQGRGLFQRSREQTAILTWEHTFSPESLLTTSLSERLVSNRLLPTSDPISIQASGLRNTLTLGLRSDYTRLIDTHQTLKAGVELTGYRLREDFNFDPRTFGEDLELSPFNFRGRKTGGVFGLYLQDRIKFNSHLVANIGLRYDQYNVLKSDRQLSPRINLAYTFARTRTTLHFAYNRLFALPPNENLLLSTFLADVGQPPRPVKSNLYELGVRQALKDQLVVSLTTFYRNDNNSFELTELANVRNFLPTAFAKGKAYGVEFSAQLAEIRRLGISGYFNYTAQRAFQTGPVAGGFSDEMVAPGLRNSPAFDQIHTGTTGITYQAHRRGLYLGVSLEYGSGTPSDGVRLPSHLVGNFSSGIDLIERDKRKISLQFNIENLTDRVYAIAKESEFTPLQFSGRRYFSGALRFNF